MSVAVSHALPHQEQQFAGNKHSDFSQELRSPRKCFDLWPSAAGHAAVEMESQLYWSTHGSLDVFMRITWALQVSDHCVSYFPGSFTEQKKLLLLHFVSEEI